MTKLHGGIALTPAQMREVKWLWHYTTMTQKEIAARYHVGRTTIGEVLDDRYLHVPFWHYCKPDDYHGATWNCNHEVRS